MSFQAIIKDLECRQIWCKSISSLSTISETLKFIITSKYISLSSLNAAMTCSFEIFFNSHFFDSFVFMLNDLNKINKDGFTFLEESTGKDENESDSDSTDNNTTNQESACFSFIIPSKYLNIIFKNMETDLGCEYVLSVNFTKNCPKAHRYKLLVEKISNKKIKKQFNPSFQPIQLKIFTKSISDFSNHYKRRLRTMYSGFEFDEDNDDYLLPLEKARRANHGKMFNNLRLFDEDDDKSLNYLNLENHILKKFLENAPSAVEDFQININKIHERLNFFSFLKPIKKDNKIYIRQPMSLCVSIVFQDIIDMYFHDGTKRDSDNDERDSIKITFRLKELRTFINLISYPFTDSPDDAGSKKYRKHVNNLNGENNNGDSYNNNSGNIVNLNQRYSLIDTNKGDFEIFFEEEGSPVVFESFLKRGLVKLRLTQITDCDGTSNHFDNTDNSKSETISIPTAPVYRKKLVPDYKVVKSKNKRTESQKRQTVAEDDRVVEKQISDLLEEYDEAASTKEISKIKTRNQLFVDQEDLQEYAGEKNRSVTPGMSGVSNNISALQSQDKTTQEISDSCINGVRTDTTLGNRLLSKMKGTKSVNSNNDQSLLTYTGNAIHDPKFNDNQFYELGESITSKQQEIDVFEPTITWNTANSQDHSVSKRKLVTEDDYNERDVIQEGEEGDHEAESERIGRTQNVNRFKGIFD